MSTFTITENNITAFAEYEDALNHNGGGAGGIFTSEKGLAKLTSEWPIGRFADIWNNFAGVVPFDGLKPVKKFTDRKTAVTRIWKAIQALTPTPAQHAAPAATKSPKATKEATNQAGATTAREGSKTAAVLALLRRADGATLATLMEATGWKAPSVRGFISGSIVKKLGLKIESTKNSDNERAYRIVG